MKKTSSTLLKMISKIIILTVLLSPFCLSPSFSQVQSDTEFKSKSILIKRLKKQVNNYNLARQAYEREVNDSIADYYAQRKAVMEKYYARQREISEKFGRKLQTTVPSYINNNSDNYFDTTTSNNADNTFNYTVRDANEYGVGHHLIGNRRNSSDDHLLYQHNIGIGLKGNSDLDAVFEVVLDEQVRMTCIELTPNNRSNASLRLISGGPGYNRVKLKFTPMANSGLSYTVKIWGYKTF